MSNLVSQIKNLFRTSSDSAKVFPTEVLDPQFFCDILAYRRFTLLTYSSLTDAQSCRITKIRGMKSVSCGRARHEYIVITISRDNAQTDVVFKRIPGTTQSNRHRTTHAEPPLSSRASESSSSSTSSLALLHQAFSLQGRVTFSHHRVSFFGGDRQTWSVEFKNPIPFYVAINIASAISTEFRQKYHPLEERCSFFTELFCEVLAKQCGPDDVEFEHRRAGAKKEDGGARNAGDLSGARILANEKVAEAVEQVYPVFLENLKAYRIELRDKDPFFKLEQVKAELEQQQAGMRQLQEETLQLRTERLQLEEETQRLKLLLAQKQQSNDDAT